MSNTDDSFFAELVPDDVLNFVIAGDVDVRSS